MNEKICDFLEEKKLIEPGDRVIAAVSGGADSVAMLHLLFSLKEKYNLTLYACHLNHQIRGAAADEDEMFVKTLCDSLGVELFSESVDIPALSKASGESEELCGREARYRFFEKLCDQLDAKVATAHTLSDSSETMLLNLTRGCGVSGLCGIPQQRGRIIRPILCLTREETEAYCESHDLDFVTDETNFSQDYSRNKLRLSVIPKLKELNPSLDQTMARMSLMMQSVEKYLTYISKKELKSCQTTYGYACEKLLALDDAVLSFSLKTILEDAGAPYEYRHLRLLKDALTTHGAVTLKDGFVADCAQGVLRVRMQESDKPELAPVRLKNWEDITYYSIKELKNVHKKFVDFCVDCAIINDETVVRRREAGDVFRDLRSGHRKSLKKMFNERKIPREKRDELLLIANGSEILFIEEIGASFDAAVKQDTKEFFIMGVNHASGLGKNIVE